MKKSTVVKELLTAIVCLMSLSSFAQKNKAEIDGTNWKAPYTLTTPAGWSVERSPLTGKISADAVEDMRLTPGWNDSKSEEYWTYASLWSLENSFKTDAESIKNALTTYYADLLIKNIKKHRVPGKKILQVRPWLIELQKENGDLKTYYGAISMLDYKSKNPISLNCVVHVRSCSGQNTLIFYEVSPKPLNDPIWKNLNQLWLDFNCTSQPYSTN